MNRIHYAFGRDYLKSWGIKDALREVFQNYIDYGQYKVVTKDHANPDDIHVTISNDYKPESLEFLRLGNTTKDNGEFIGHHGEGLKAAFLIFARDNKFFRIYTNDYILSANFKKDTQIGETLYIEYKDLFDIDKHKGRFTTVFVCNKQDYYDFVNDLITEDDVLYKGYCGDLLKATKTKGNIYCGGLFVCNITDLNNSYNIKPAHLALDRDRRAPKDWDLDYSTSRIYQEYLESIKHKPDIQVGSVNYNARDYSYQGSIPESSIQNIEAVVVKGAVQYYDKANDQMISNYKVKETLDNHPKFKKVKDLSYREKVLTRYKDCKRKLVSTLIKEFKKKHCHNNDDMNIDIDVILRKISKDKVK